MNKHMFSGTVANKKYYPGQPAAQPGSAPAKVSYITFTVRVPRKLTKQQRQENAAARQQNPTNPVYPHQSVDWFNCCAYSTQADIINTNYGEGDLIVVTDAVYQTRQYQDVTTGSTRYSNEFIIREVEASYNLVSNQQAQRLLQSHQNSQNAYVGRPAAQSPATQSPVTQSPVTQAPVGQAPAYHTAQPQQNSYQAPAAQPNAYQPNAGYGQQAGYSAQAPTAQQSAYQQPQQSNGLPLGITGNDLPF